MRLRTLLAAAGLDAVEVSVGPGNRSRRDAGGAGTVAPGTDEPGASAVQHVSERENARSEPGGPTWATPRSET